MIDHRRGTTLLEVLIAVSITVILFTLVSSIFIETLRNTRLQTVHNQAADEARRVLTQMSRVLRLAQPSVSGAYPIVAAGGNSLTFYSVIDATNQIKQVRYFITGTNLQMGVIAPSGNTYPAANEVITTVLPGVQNGAQNMFDYYDNTYTGSQNPMNPIVINTIRYIRTTIIYDDDTTKLPLPITLRFSAELRNLKDNY